MGDMEDIYNYIANILQAPENAMGQYNRIADAIQKLDIFPERVRIMKSEPDHTMGLRQLSIDNFSVFYAIEGDKVIVTYTPLRGFRRTPPRSLHRLRAW